MRNFMKHNKQTIEQREKERDLCLLIALCAIVVTVGDYYESHRYISPCPDTGCHVAVVYADETT